MRARIKKVILFTVLAGVAAYVALDPAGDGVSTGGEPSASTGRGETGAAVSSPQGAAPGERAGRLALPDRIALGEPRAELFGPHSWQPPAPRAAATAPRVPTAPPMPYQFAGKLLQDGRLQVFLAKGESVVAIQEGDTLDGGYRVESIGETQVTLIYLPLKQKQSIVVSSWLPPAAAGTSTGAPASSRATLSWRAPDTIKVGEDVKVELLVKTDGALRSLPLQVSFDPGALQFVEVQEGMFFKQGGQQTSFAHNVDQANGRLFVGITRSGADGAKGEDGLLTIVFRAKARIPRSELRVLAATAVSVGPGAVTVGLPQPQVLSVVQ